FLDQARFQLQLAQSLMEADSATVLAITLASFLVLVLPGYVWLTWLAPGPEGKDRAGRLALAIGISLSLNALLAETAFFLGIEVSPEGLAAVYAVFGILALVSAGLALRKFNYQRKVQQRQASEPQEEGPTRASRWRGPAAVTLAILAGFLALVFWRFYQARDLSLPAWVDSLHHVLIVRLILENGSIPASFGPYMPVPFYYHFGFHISAALFSFWSRLPPEWAVLALGQVLNAAAALSVYQLGMALWSDRRRAVIAGLIVGFVSQMPAYYLTWGRYTLLAGLVILPLAMATALELLRFGWRRERVARLALLSAGLLLTHYIAAVLLAAFVLIGLVYSLISRRYLEGETGRERAWAGVLGGAAAGFVLALPWIARVWEYARLYTTVSNVPLDAPLDTVYFSGYLSYLWFLLGPDRNYILLALAGLGILVSGWRRKSVPLLLWALALLLLSSPWGPRLNPLRPDHVVIVLFIPVSLFIADGLAVAWDWLAGKGLGRAAGLVTGLVLAVLLAWGVWDTQVITNPVTLIADQADVRALDWIEQNTPPGARFFISAIHWQNGAYRGVDGGWWILPLTGRQTLVPPAMYLLGERDYALQINGWGERAAQLQGCGAEMWALFEEAGLDFVYVKDGVGSLQAVQLDACPGLEEVYARDGVHIFEINRMRRGDS
ncbi:MAG TPA: DUF6541 family protein, partial [Anaerolineales bacterium]|nr:DUF6541 family protein [Anaerolineales bacterium]